MLKDGRLSPHRRVVEMNEIGVEILNPIAYDAFEVFPIAGMHEVDPAAKGLISVEHRLSQEVRDKPLFCLWFFQEKGFVRNRASYVQANANPVLLERTRQRASIFNMLALGLTAKVMPASFKA